jgi:hypothetical protein
MLSSKFSVALDFSTISFTSDILLVAPAEILTWTASYEEEAACLYTGILGLGDIELLCIHAMIEELEF